MRKLKIILFILLASGMGSSNLLAQRNYVASGGNAASADGSISFSVGQIDYIEASGSGGKANQGMQQPFEFFLLDQAELPASQLEVALFPNPTLGDVNLYINEPLPEGLIYILFDLYGRQVAVGNISMQHSALSMAHLASSTYLLVLRAKETNLKTFKIIKH